MKHEITDVESIVTMEVSELMKLTSAFTLGTEKYADFVIYDEKGVLAESGVFVSHPVSNISEEILHRTVNEYSVEPDPQDVDTLIVRIYV